MTDTEIHEPEIAPHPEPPVDRPRSRSIRRRIIVTVAAATAVGLLIGLLALRADGRGASNLATVDEDGDPRTTSTTPTAAPALVGGPDTTVGLPSQTTAMQPAPPTTSRPSVAGAAAGRRIEVAADPMSRWTLYFHEASRCAEIVADGRSYPNLLCGAAPAAPTAVVGDIVTVDTPRGRVLVGTADGRVTGFSAYPRQGGAIFHEGTVGAAPSPDALRFVAGTVPPQWGDVLVRGGAHHLARIVVPPENRAYATAEVERALDPPYGEWSDYRKLTSTGYYMAGDQELGVYAGSGGQPCVLYRRFGGTFENVIADGCIDPSAGHLSVVALENISGDYMKDAYIVAAGSDTLGQVVVELPDGTKLSNLNPYPDERTGAVAWAQLGHVTIPSGVTTVDFVLTRDGVELARRTITVPRS
jgi:hypothetical protein